MDNTQHSGWVRNENFLVSTPTLRSRIRHAWQILTTGKTTYRMSMHYKIEGNHSILIDEETLVRIQDSDGTP